MNTNNNDKLVLMAKSFVPSIDSVSHHNISTQDQVTAFLHIRLKTIPNARSIFEKWINNILTASQNWKTGAWAGRMVLTTLDSNEYVVIFRFKTYALMHGWLTSSERRKWMSKLDSLGCSEQVDTDLQEGIVAFMPQSMVNVAWRCVSARDDIQDDMLPKQTRSEPPPKWKSALVVWSSLQLTVLPWDLGVGPSLKATGLPLGWRILLTLFCIVPFLKLFLLPLLDRCCHCFLFGRKCCPKVEPCLSLQIGCACCRNRSDISKDDDGDRVTSLELHVHSIRRMQSVARRRLLERIEKLESVERRNNKLDDDEDESTAIAIDAHESTLLDVVAESDIVANESTALLAMVEEQGSSTNNNQGEAKEDESIKSSGTMDDNAWTVCVAYEVRKNCFVQFEEWVLEMARTAAAKSVGHRGCVIIERPRIGSFSSNGTTGGKEAATHVVVFQYDTREHLQAWGQHSARNEMVARLQPLLEPKSLTKLQIVVYDSLTDITGNRGSRLVSSSISDNGDQENEIVQQQSQQQRPIRHDPQAWKISFVIASALFIVIWFVGIPIVGPWVETWGVKDSISLQVLQTMIGTFVNVLFLTYLLMPILVPLAGPWLFASWRESNWLVVRVLQRGFQCWDTVGMKLRESGSGGER